MLTNQELGSLRLREKAFKVSDRDGLYAAVLPTGTISFRYDYRLNGRRETLAIGRYDAGLARVPAREPIVLEYGMRLAAVEAVRDYAWSVDHAVGRRKVGNPMMLINATRLHVAVMEMAARRDEAM